MASDRPGYFTRLKNSVIGFLMGMAMFLLAIPFLAWNENNVYKVRQGLKEGAKVVQSVPAQPDSSRDQQLIHISGPVTTSRGVSDPVFQLDYDMLRLRRTVEMYQWDEDRETRDGKTRYTYDQEWSESHNDSSRFHSAGHDNPPPPPYSSEDFIANDARLGTYRVEPGQLRSAGGLAGVSNVQLPSQLIAQGWSGGHGNVWFRGRGTLQSPQIGDVRVTFTALPEGDMSLVGMQQGDRLAPWISSRDTEVLLVERGVQTAAVMFEHAQSRNSALGWALRAAGFAGMWIGLSLCLGPLSAVLSFIPGLSGIVSRVSGFVAFLIALIFAVTTIVLSWIFVRPLVLMLVIGGIVAVALIIGRLRGEKQPSAAPPPPPTGATMPPPPPPPPPAG